MTFLPIVDVLVTGFKFWEFCSPLGKGWRFLKDLRYHHNDCFAIRPGFEFNAKAIFDWNFPFELNNFL